MFDTTIHLGDVVVTAIGTVALFGMRRCYILGKRFLTQHDQLLVDVDDAAEVINLHTDIIIKHGLLKGELGIPRLERRRRARVYVEPVNE